MFDVRAALVVTEGLWASWLAVKTTIDKTKPGRAYTNVVPYGAQ